MSTSMVILPPAASHRYPHLSRRQCEGRPADAGPHDGLEACFAPGEVHEKLRRRRCARAVALSSISDESARLFPYPDRIRLLADVRWEQSAPSMVSLARSDRAATPGDRAYLFSR